MQVSIVGIKKEVRRILKKFKKIRENIRNYRRQFIICKPPVDIFNFLIYSQLKSR